MHDFEMENLTLRQAVGQAPVLLNDAAKRLNGVRKDEPIMAESPQEAWAAIDCAVEDISTALRSLEAVAPKKNLTTMPSPDALTRQQGQFLAFIREYLMRNEAGVAPTHAALQRFFNLTPPSVNSMLIRLEQRGFIRRIPGKARAIELIINPKWIPSLERPFRF